MKKFIDTDNSDYFKVWSSNMAYVLGFFTGDGCLALDKRYNQYCISFDIHEKDIVVLEFIKSEINPNRNIRNSSTKDKRTGFISNKVHLYIGNQIICKDIMNFGFPLRKTYNMPIFNIPEEYRYDYLRGLFDADGSLAICNRKDSSTKRYSWYISNINKDYLENLRKKLNINLGKIIQSKDKCFWRIDRELEIREICNKIYNGNFCLERKYKRYLEMPKNKTDTKFCLFGESKYIYDWAIDLRCKTNRKNFLRRINKGWSFEEAFLTSEIKNQHQERYK